jgi:flagellar basal body-associated protein FliL
MLTHEWDRRQQVAEQEKEAEALAKKTAENEGHAVSSEKEETAPVSEPTSQPGEFLYAYELKNQALEFLPKRKVERPVHARLTLVFDCPSSAAKNRLEASRSQLKDRVLEATRSISAEALREPGAIVLLKERVMALVRNDFGEFAPHGVAVRDWVVY